MKSPTCCLRGLMGSSGQLGSDCWGKLLAGLRDVLVMDSPGKTVLTTPAGAVTDSSVQRTGSSGFQQPRLTGLRAAVADPPGPARVALGLPSHSVCRQARSCLGTVQTTLLCTGQPPLLSETWKPQVF